MSDNARFALRASQRAILSNLVATNPTGRLARAIGISPEELVAVAEGATLPTMSSRSRIIQHLIRNMLIGRQATPPDFSDQHGPGAEGFENLDVGRGTSGWLASGGPMQRRGA